jgi:azurin
MIRRPSLRVCRARPFRAHVRRAGAGLAGAVLLSLLTASSALSSSDEQVAHVIAGGHGVAHDARAVAAIDRWLALGQPAGLSMRASTASQDDGPVDRTVTIRTSGSNLSFDPDALSLKAGTRVRIQYINDGVLPHNFVVLKSEDDLDALGAAAYDAEATGFVPLDQKDKLIAYTTLAAPGTTVSVTFEVPAPGEYTFVCLFPGHYNVMLGTLRALR